MAGSKITEGEVGGRGRPGAGDAAREREAAFTCPMRDDSGELVQLHTEGAAEDAAREELLARVKGPTTHTRSIVTGASTIAEAAEAWLPAFGCGRATRRHNKTATPLELRHRHSSLSPEIR